MRLLELFSGTGSVGTVFKEYGWEVVSLDRDMPADISCDIMDWDYRNSPYPLKHFDVIWASPPCTEYSKAKTRGVRKLDEANAVVERTLEIFGHFQPSIYFLENPQTGLLKTSPSWTSSPTTMRTTASMVCPTESGLACGTTASTSYRRSAGTTATPWTRPGGGISRWPSRA